MVFPLIAPIAGAILGDQSGFFGDVGEAFKDFSNNGKNRYQDPGYTLDPNQGAWGGEQGAAQDWMNMARQGMGGAQGMAGWAGGEAQRDRGPQAYENAYLADREAQARFGDQNGALQLAREAAMGMAPSEAAYQMQAGLDRALSNQAAMAGGARGAAGLANAQANAAANIGNLQNQTFNQAGQLRAQEMAQARGLYGGLAGQQREQDLQRLGQGNQMAQFNAGLNDQYRLGMANAANQFGNQAQGWYGQGAQVGQSAGALGGAQAQLGADIYNQQQARAAGVAQANADHQRGNRDMWLGLAGSAVNTGGNIAAARGGGGGTKPPTA